MIIWITGLPGSGKTSTARKFARLFPKVLMLDGDEVRKWLTDDCDYSDKGRLKHANRVYQVAKRASTMGEAVIVSLVAHPPGDVQMLVWVDGPSRRELWKGTIYTPPESYDVRISTWSK
jgi:adenylylsulfate kinase-like enzyme